jgi:serine/threonine-protein kinase
MTQPAASDIRVGAVLRDTYEITSLLGKGGMGAVFLARHRRLPGKQVAVKVLLNGASLNPELYARFRREAEIASRLGHPNIVEVLDFDTLQDGTPFLVMEYLRGESLEQRLERERPPVDAVLSLTRQIGSALQAAHRAGVVHRDLKPANVFLVPTDSGGVVGERVKLLDFGISKMLDSQTLQTQDAVLIGTPQYMAPEQALGKNSEIDARTDIFALGCIVYEMLAGRPPFAGEGGSIVQVVFRIVHTQPEPLASLRPDVPERILSAVERALAKDPRDRYPDVAAFIAELTGSPLQSLSGAAVPSFSASRGASVPASPEEGFAATHVPSSTARFPAPAAAASDDVGFAATLGPSSPARPAPVPAPADDRAFAATHVPSSTARFPAPVAQPPPASPAAVPPAPSAPPSPGGAPVAAQPPFSGRPRPMKDPRVLVLVIGLAAAGGWFGSRSNQTPVQAPVSAAPVPVAATAPVAPVAPAPEKPAETKAPPAPAAPAAPAVTESKPAPSQPTRPAANEALPEEVRDALHEAEKALRAGDAEEAIRLARGTLSTLKTSASYSVMTRAYCHQRDLGGAKAKWREGQKTLSSSDRGQVKQYCKQYDIEF